MLIYVNGVNYCLNINHTKYLAQTLRWTWISYVLENFHRKLVKLVAPPTDGTV